LLLLSNYVALIDNLLGFAFYNCTSLARHVASHNSLELQIFPFSADSIGDNIGESNAPCECRICSSRRTRVRKYYKKSYSRIVIQKLRIQATTSLFPFHLVHRHMRKKMALEMIY